MKRAKRFSRVDSILSMDVQLRKLAYLTIRNQQR